MDNLETENPEAQYQNFANTLIESPLFTSASKGYEMVNKQLLFLAAAGVKPVCAAAGGHLNESKTDVVYEDEPALKDLLQSLGLKSRLEVIPNKDGHPGDPQLICSKSEDLLNEYIHSDDPIRRGQLLGFPKTAVETYSELQRHEIMAYQEKSGPVSEKQWILGQDEEQILLKEAGFEDDFIEYLAIRLSRNNYLEEAKEQLEQFNLLKKYGLVAKSE